MPGTTGLRDRRSPLARAGADRILLGVCAGIAHRLGRDPWLIRAGFLLGTAAGGVGVAAYGVGAVALENPAAGDEPPSRRSRAGMIAAISLLAFAIVLALALDDRLIDTGAVISVSLLLAGASLVWRRTGGIDFTGDLEGARVIRIVLGLGLVLVGIVLYGGTNTDLSSAGAAVIAAGIVAAGAGLIFAPRLAATREALDEARRERIRAEEQEAIASRLHDSVLQTLALIEREAEPGSRAAALARRQERELRGVLYGEARPGEETFGAALREIAARVEEGHGIKVELVQTRDVPLDEGTEALAGAAGEALTNAAKHAGVDTVSAMVRVGDGRITVFVRDRGSGFDPEARTDGHGIEGSIESRLARVGGGATIDSTAEHGTEIELWAPLAPTADGGGE
jgi:signal transduction histidine kinase/phage shock protein PspC (stress-responsive transcriptional regulator)